MRWFGPDSNRAHALQEASIVDASGSDMRARFITRSAPLMRAVDGQSAFDSVEPDFANFDEATRRRRGSAPDADTIQQIRGDKNRAFLMD